MLKNGYAKILVLLTSITFPLLTNIQWGILIFSAAFMLDFFTGWFASYIEIKNGDKVMPKSGYAFESVIARKSLVKGVWYILFIFSAYVLEMMFLDKKITAGTLTTKTFGFTELAIGFCTGIELYSTLIENGKRMGFDIIKKVETIADSFWALKKKILNK